MAQYAVSPRTARKALRGGAAGGAAGSGLADGWLIHWPLRRGLFRRWGAARSLDELQHAAVIAIDDVQLARRANIDPVRLAELRLQRRPVAALAAALAGAGDALDGAVLDDVPANDVVGGVRDDDVAV